MIRFMCDFDEVQKYKDVPGVLMFPERIVVISDECPPEILKELKVLKKKWEKENEEIRIQLMEQQKLYGICAEDMAPEPTIKILPPVRKETFDPG